MVYVIAALGLPTLACMVHAKKSNDDPSFRGGLVMLGAIVVLGLVLLPVIGVD
jgi:hypothetical protein